jgi:PKD repeat protein
MTWQWLINGTNFVGATNSSITITNATAAETGRYSVLVSNDAGTIASQEAILKLVSVVKGQVTDALNGKPLHGVMVSMGGVTNITDASGNYRLDDVNPGSAHADFDADVRTGAAPLRVNFINLSTLTGNTLNATTNGYDAYSDQKVKVIPNEAVTVNFSMSPILPANTMRLVLNWRSDPKDLDAHLLTPSINGSNYHVYYNPGSRGSLTNWPFASLDFDYTNGFGPETMTITNFYDGTYQFFVHHYSSDAPSTNSGAAVRIYTAENPPRIIDVPNLLHGQYFHVCNIDGVTRNITVIQQILDTSPFLQKQSGTVIKPNSIAATRRILAIDEAQTARYLWDFGDGSTSSEDAPGKTYSIPGEYTVTLRMETSGSQYHVIEKTNFITVLQAAQPEIQISNIRVQEGNAGLADALFPVTLSRPGNQAVSIDYYTTNGTAKADERTHAAMYYPCMVNHCNLSRAVCKQRKCNKQTCYLRMIKLL